MPALDQANWLQASAAIHPSILPTLLCAAGGSCDQRARVLEDVVRGSKFFQLEARLLAGFTQLVVRRQHHLDFHLKALINASNCVRNDLSWGVMGGTWRSIANNS